MSQIHSRIDTRSEAYQANQEHYQNLLTTLRERTARAMQGGHEKLRDRHHQRGKILARDRIDRLVDPATSFLEFSTLAAYAQYGGKVHSAGIVTGIGIVCGTPCVIIANDATVKGGSYYHETVKKHVRAQEIAGFNRLPCLYLVDCGGGYLPEQDRVFPDRDHFGNGFWRQCRMSASGLPQISAVFGGCTAGGAYIPALSDQVIMVDGNARIHLGGPSIVKVAVNETVDGESLGGAAMHTRESGVSDHIVSDEPEAIALLRDLVSQLNMPQRFGDASEPVQAPLYDPNELGGVVSHDRRIPYEVREVIARLVDASELVEFKPEWGESLVCGTAKIHGQRVGILGNNGALYSESALKGAHFIALCEQRQIPLLFLQNISGYMVGSEAERGGISKHSAKMVYAVANAQVPKLTVVIGGSYGAGNYGMCGRGFRPDFLFAWPTAEIATMSPDIASNVMLELRRTNLKLPPPTDAELAEVEKAVREQYVEQTDPYYATSRLWDDGLIEPAQTRDVLGLCLSLIASRPVNDRHTPVYRM